MSEVKVMLYRLYTKDVALGDKHAYTGCIRFKVCLISAIARLTVEIYWPPNLSKSTPH